MISGPVNPLHEERPWGSFDRLVSGKPVTVKLITVASGEAFSKQVHHKRDEFWRIISGEGIVEIDEEKKHAKIGDNFWIPQGTTHRLSAGGRDVVFLELSFGDFDENDITRLEDKYGRV